MAGESQVVASEESDSTSIGDDLDIVVIYQPTLAEIRFGTKGSTSLASKMISSFVDHTHSLQIRWAWANKLSCSIVQWAFPFYKQAPPIEEHIVKWPLRN